MQQAAIALTVVSQHVLKNVVQLAKVVIMRGHLQHIEKSVTPFGTVRCSFATKAHGERDDVTNMVAIPLLRCAIAGAMGERFAHNTA